jgi:hypothetical protein
MRRDHISGSDFHEPACYMGRVNFRALVLLGAAVALAACGRNAPSPAASTTGTSSPSPISSVSIARGPSTAALHCTTDLHFPSPLKVPEASIAAEVELRAGVREMLVVSDSGNSGAAILWKIPDGPVRNINLPLDDGASDDLEGGAWRGGHLFIITSSGAVRRYSPDGHGALAEDGSSYRIGPPPYSCADLGKVNCGKNYEGLCLRADSPADGSTPRCIGYAASKKEGALYCVVMMDNRLAIDTVRKPLVLPLERDSLSDCAFGAWGGPAQNTLVITTNIHGGSTSYVVDEATGELKTLDVPSTLTNEAIAIDKTGALYQMMDDNGDESLALRMTCSGW